jgi:hypothetical protein
MVRVRRRGDLFFVLRAFYDREIADLVEPVTDKVLCGVRFDSLFARFEEKKAAEE